MAKADMRRHVGQSILSSSFSSFDNKNNNNGKSDNQNGGSFLL